MRGETWLKKNQPIWVRRWEDATILSSFDANLQLSIDVNTSRKSLEIHAKNPPGELSDVA
jgi:hypothetical protein